LNRYRTFLRKPVSPRKASPYPEVPLPIMTFQATSPVTEWARHDSLALHEQLKQRVMSQE
ncbi:MAG: hypothetical protein L6433_02535, partial [Actinomycetia bacterium]|nr:hypothetical protein [Actinomycetes bacterium]